MESTAWDKINARMKTFTQLTTDARLIEKAETKTGLDFEQQVDIGRPRRLSARRRSEKI